MIEPLAPFGFGEIKPVRRQRLIGRAAAGLVDAVLSRLIIVGDLGEPLVRGFLVERLDRDRASVDVVEQRFELVVEQRQPMLHAGMAAAFAHRLVEHVVRARRAERRHIAGAKLTDRFRRQLEFRHRHEIERAQIVRGALGHRIEVADQLQRVAEEIETHRRVHAGREQIDDAAAHRVVAGLAHGRSAVIAVKLKPLGDAGHWQDVARCSGERLAADHLARRHPLQDGVHGGQQRRRCVAAFDAGEPRQGVHALRHDADMRRHPIVRQTIPGGKFQNFDVGREEAERARQHRHARPVAADHRYADRRRLRACGDRTGEIGNDKPFGAIGNAGQRQCPTRRKPRRRRFCLREHSCGHLSPCA